MPLVTQVLTLTDLPPPLLGKTGWPWTEQSELLPAHMPNGIEWPRISIVTPSYNQGQFIEETIRSVLLQGYPNLEYIIIDGDSTDKTVEIIKKYEPWITYWVSEPDQGQSHALNKGFSRATGELVGWQNSDDYYHAGSFGCAAIISNSAKEVDVFYGFVNNVDLNGNFIRAYPVSEFDISNMIPYLNMCNQAMFFRQRIFKDGYLIDESFRHAMDLDFLLRLAQMGYQFRLFPEIAGYYRIHPAAKGATLEDVCATDCLRIYSSIYTNPSSPSELRKKAYWSIYGVCIDSFGKRRLKAFREHMKEFVKVAGLRGLKLNLCLKYVLSYLGSQNLNYLRQIIIFSWLK
jgi:glycosyltransferase involved in cell wall biosynthesis